MRTGYFGVVNLLGPRTEAQGQQWRSDFTYVQLRLEFLSENGTPLTIWRTYMTFFDFDTGAPQFDASNTQLECMQIGPEARQRIVTDVTEIVTFSSWQAFADTTGGTLPSALAYDDWSTPIGVASTYGVGKDNPIDPYTLTMQQEQRAIMALFEGVSTLRVGRARDAVVSLYL